MHVWPGGIWETERGGVVSLIESLCKIEILSLWHASNQRNMQIQKFHIWSFALVVQLKRNTFTNKLNQQSSN